MGLLSILHLSDLHLSTRSYSDQSVVLQALFCDLENRREQGEKFDLVFLTGDLIAKGAYIPANTSLLRSGFIDPLLTAAGLSPERLFICPGNHDLDHSKVSALIRPSLEAIKTTETVNAAIEGLGENKWLSAGLQGFNDVVDGLGLKPIFKNELFRAYQVCIGGIKLGICAINSAWRSSGSPNNEDYGKLIVGQRQLDMLSSAVADCDVKFALLHHPLSWLAHFEATDVQRDIYRKFDAIFFGHNHTADSSQVAFRQSSIFVSNAGCLYQSRKYFNGYTSLQYDRGVAVWHVNVREYFEERQAFDASTRFATDGRITYEISEGAKGKAVIPAPSGDYIAAVHEAIDSQLLPTLVSEIAPRNLKALYVEPPLSHISERQLNEDASNGDSIKYLSLEEIIASGRPTFFVGPKECGKTTLLHYICGESSGLAFHERPRFGCYVNLATVKRTRASLLESIVAFSKGAYRRAEFIQLLGEGRMNVCFDNLDTTHEDILSVLQEFIREFPENRYYFSVQESFQASLTQRAIPRLGLDADVVYFHSFGRRHIRSLVGKWFGDDGERMQDAVDGLVGSLRRLNIPRTPFLISIFLWVYERRATFNPVNQAEIIDTFVDGVLEKLYEKKERGSLDSNIKRHFLSELAYRMHSSGKKVCSHHELEKFAAEYFEKTLLPSPSGPFIEELKRKGLLLDLGDHVAFRFECLRAFFLSHKLSDSPDLMTYALSDAGFVQMHEELDYFTGRHRDRADVLRKAMEIMDRAYKAAGFDLPLTIFDEFSLEGSPINSEQRVELERLFFGERPTLQEREALLDTFDDMPVRSSKAVAPRRVHSGASSVTNFVDALRTASVVLRNSELIDAPELKHQSYAALTFYWSQFLLTVLAVFEVVADSEIEKMAKEAMPDVPGETLRYAMRVMIPNAVFMLSLEALGTKKLQLVIEKAIDESTETVRKLLNVVLYADLALPNRIEKIRQLVERSGESRFLLELLLAKLVHLFMFRRISEKEEKDIKNLAADVFARINASGSTGRQRAELRARIITLLDRKKLFQRLEKGAADKA